MASPRIFHLLSPEAWHSSQADGRVAPPSLENEGFVHCSTREQITGTIERHFDLVDELMLLELDEAAIGDELRWEESRPGEPYPHLYRAIELREVSGVVCWRRGTDGSVRLPDDL